jgi:carbon storage regulator
MLVLSRKRGERLVLPHLKVAVTVLAVEGQAVRLGISAPMDVAVHREEVWQRLCQQASDSAPERAGAPEKVGQVKGDKRKGQT